MLQQIFQAAATGKWTGQGCDKYSFLVLIYLVTIICNNLYDIDWFVYLFGTWIVLLIFNISILVCDTSYEWIMVSWVSEFPPSEFF